MDGEGSPGNKLSGIIRRMSRFFQRNSGKKSASTAASSAKSISTNLGNDDDEMDGEGGGDTGMVVVESVGRRSSPGEAILFEQENYMNAHFNSENEQDEIDAFAESDANEDEDDVEWSAPESWAVNPRPKPLTRSGKQAFIGAKSSKSKELVWIRVHRGDSAQDDTSCISLIGDSTTSAIAIQIPKYAKARAVCDMLARNFASAAGGGRNVISLSGRGRCRLFLQRLPMTAAQAALSHSASTCNMPDDGCTKTMLESCANLPGGSLEILLEDDECPGQIQDALLQDYGFVAGQDDLGGGVGRVDMAFLFKWIYRPPPLLPVNTTTKSDLNNASGLSKTGVERKSCCSINVSGTTAYLADANLAVIPASVFQMASSIETMDVSRNGLLPQLPSDLLEQMPRLRVLRSVGCWTGRLPGGLVHLAPSLQHLSYAQNLLTGDALKPLLHLVNLRSLDLSGNRLESLPDCLETLKSLTSLTVSSNRLKVWPKCLWKMHQLVTLDVSFNCLPRVPSSGHDDKEEEQVALGFGQLRLLRTLFAAANQITSIPGAGCFGKCLFLREVDLCANPGLQSVGDLVECRSLQSVKLDDCAAMVLHLSSATWPQLAYLSATGCPGIVCNHSFALPACRFLDLRRCGIRELPGDFFEQMCAVTTCLLDENLVEAIPPMPQSISHPLKHLSLANNRLEGSAEDLLQPLLPSNNSHSLLPDLRVLDLHGNALDGPIPASLWTALPSLSTLNLASNELTEWPLLPSFNQTPALPCTLKYLSLADNRLDNDVLDAIGLLHGLLHLNLSLNRLSDVGDALRSLSNLRFLALSGNYLGGLPEDLGVHQSTSLQCLLLNDNDIHVPSADLGKCRKMQVADLAGNNLKYNIGNWAYDWNWAWNVELRHLDLSDNPRLEIRPLPQMNHIILHTTHNNGNSNGKGNDGSRVNDFLTGSVVRPALDHPFPSPPGKPSQGGGGDRDAFAALKHLHYVNLTNTAIKAVCVPEEKVDFRVRADHSTDTATQHQQFHVERTAPFVGVGVWSGTPASQAHPSDDEKTVAGEKHGCGKLSFDIFDFHLRSYLGHARDHLIGLFDGRGSPLVSGLLYDRLDNTLHAQLRQLQPSHANNNDDVREGDDREHMLQAAIHGEDVRAALRRTFLYSALDIHECPGYATYGASAAVVFVTDQCVHVACAGDIQAVLAWRPKQHQQGSPSSAATSASSSYRVLHDGRKHSPWNAREQSRILSTCNACAWFGSEQGKLSGAVSVTRALGYHQLLPAVTPCPSITTIDVGKGTLLTKDHAGNNPSNLSEEGEVEADAFAEAEFLILGTKQVWTVLSHEAAVETVRSILRGESSASSGVSAEASYGKAGRRLRDLVLARGIPGESTQVGAFTVMVVGLRELCCVGHDEEAHQHPGAAADLSSQSRRRRKTYIERESSLPVTKNIFSFQFNSIQSFLDPFLIIVGSRCSATKGKHHHRFHRHQRTYDAVGFVWSANASYHDPA